MIWTLLGGVINTANFHNYKLLKLESTNIEIYTYVYNTDSRISMYFYLPRNALGGTLDHDYNEDVDLTFITQDLVTLFHTPKDTYRLSSLWRLQI